jgi:hypothetical protein
MHAHRALPQPKRHIHPQRRAARQAHTRYVFVPGPGDSGPGDLLPRPPLPAALTGALRAALPSAVFASNPCRLRHYSQVPLPCPACPAARSACRAAQRRWASRSLAHVTSAELLCVWGTHAGTQHAGRGGVHGCLVWVAEGMRPVARDAQRSTRGGGSGGLCAQEIVVFRGDLEYRMRRMCLRPPAGAPPAPALRTAWHLTTRRPHPARMPPCHDSP